MIVYKTTNLLNNKIYIGKDSKNNELYLGSGLLLQKAIKKYGKENFKKEILEYCNNTVELNEKEKFWINFYDSRNVEIGYNLAEGGDGGRTVKQEWKKGKKYEEVYGIEKTKEIKEKFSKLRKNKKRSFVNITPEEVGQKISKSLLGKKMKRSDEHRKKISNTLKKFFKSEAGVEQRKQVSERAKKSRSIESNNKRSQKLKGIKRAKRDYYPSSRIWYLYDKDNKLIINIIGNLTKTLKDLKTYHGKTVKFKDLQKCLEYELPKNRNFKIYSEKYYKK